MIRRIDEEGEAQTQDRQDQLSVVFQYLGDQQRRRRASEGDRKETKSYDLSNVSYAYLVNVKHKLQKFKSSLGVGLLGHCCTPLKSYHTDFSLQP
ncbi:hypothetical protein RUM43_005334 [Polyplax serrata]|uniref:Uncharacterized protein n=1 Tax=Polyplax serrata TaxID=468196 RepID=A0AAN8S1E3_POLSC